MWIFPTKKEVKKEFNKIANSFKSREKRIDNNSKEIIKTNLKIARLEGVISMLVNQKSQSHSQRGIRPVSDKLETKVIKRLRKSRKLIVIAEIRKLEASLSVIEMYEDIVLNKGLCSKASFYRYIASLNSLKVKEIEIKER